MRFFSLLFPIVLLNGQIIISPNQPSVPAGQTITITSNTPVTWNLNGRGSLSNVTGTSATFTAPSGIVPKNQMLGCPVGPNDSIFNTRIDALPVHAKSNAWINYSTVNSTVFETDNWGISIGDATTATKTLRTYYSDTTIPNFAMPAGPNLKRQGGAHVGTFGLPSAPDHHILTVRHTDCTFYESYDDYIDGYTRACRDGSAGCNVQSAITYPAMNYAVIGPDGGTNAGGLPLAPTTWGLTEIQSGTINHATVFTTNTGSVAFNSFIWPASATGGGCDIITCPNAMPMGVRLRLRSSFNIAAVCNSGIARRDAACTTMLTALKQYGMILCDTGLANAVQMMSDVSEDTEVQAAVDQLSNARIPFTSFEAVDESSLEVNALSYQVCPLGKACLNGTNSYVAPSDQAIITATASGASLSTPIALQGVAIGLGVPQSVAIAAGSYSYQIPYWVNGSSNQTVSWSLLSGAGSVSSAGMYTPPSGTAAIGVPGSAILRGVSAADPAATTTLRLTILPTASNGAIRIDTGALTPSTDGSGNVWTADIGIEGGASSISSDYPHWNKANVASDIVYESLQKGADLGHTLIVPNGSYNVHLLFGMPDAGNCTGCVSWLTLGTWNQYDFAPYILETQGVAQNSNFNWGALSNYTFQTPIDAYVPANVTNNLLQVYVRSVMSDLPPYSVPLDSTKHTFLNGLEILPSGATTVNTAPSWAINTVGQTTISPGQTLVPFSIISSGGAPNDPTWSIVSGPRGASLSGSTVSLAANALPNGVPIVVQAHDATLTATTSIATLNAVKPVNPFTYRRPLTIAHSLVGTADLTNFTVVLSVTDPTLANKAYGGHVTNASGYDIAFASDAAGQNQLHWEIEQYNETTGTLVAHIQIPALSHTADTTVFMLYGDSNINTLQGAPHQAWDSNYLAVYHFQGPPLTISDSTSNAHSATQSGLTYSSAGLIGGAASDTLQNAMLPPVILDQPQGTLEAWISTSQSETKNSTWSILSQSGATRNDYFHLGWSGFDNQFEAIWSSSQNGTTRLGFAPSQMAIGNNRAWVHVAYSWNAANNTQALYINGVLLATSSSKIPLLTSATPVILGSGFSGLLDELRFSNVVRPGNWITADYTSQNSPSRFIQVGSEVVN